MLEFLQIALPYLPFFLLLPTILTSTLLLFLIAFGAPKFMKIYSVILAVYIIANLLTATTFAIIQPRLYLYNDGHLFSTRLSLSGSILFALPIHLLHFTILILLYILFVRFLALRGVLINQRAALISVFALYFTVPIGLLLAVSSVDTASIEVEGKTLNLFVMDSFWDCLFTEASIFLPIFWAVVSIILNFSANSIVFSREISLGYVHRVLICKKMAESIMYQILIVSLCISGSGWIPTPFCFHYSSIS
ncbi:unnamed protein product, partial [Mesorhabditis belari]|uniref:Uncharacterized protein n=1 Tax=Mesorhabditis belari TaxID=2138241 RepID=A0AAF3ENU7_9BILA